MMYCYISIIIVPSYNDILIFPCRSDAPSMFQRNVKYSLHHISIQDSFHTKKQNKILSWFCYN